MRGQEARARMAAFNKKLNPNSAAGAKADVAAVAKARSPTPKEPKESRLRSPVKEEKEEKSGLGLKKSATLAPKQLEEMTPKE